MNEPNPAEEARSTDLPEGMAVRNYVAGMMLYSLGFLAISLSPYYKNLTSQITLNWADTSDPLRAFLTKALDIVGRTSGDSLRFIYCVYVAQATLRFLFRLVTRKEPEAERPYRFWDAIAKLLRHNAAFLRGRPKVRPKPSLTRAELTDVLYFVMKFFYLTLMWSFLYGNVATLSEQFGRTIDATTEPFQAQVTLYLRAINTIFVIDVLVFLFGYMFEVKGKSIVRSVEGTALGWAVALMCYPPFVGVFADYLPFRIPEVSLFFNSHAVTSALLIVSALLFAIYGWSSIALGMRASNLTNRGIVSRGPYRVVRHPAYISKNLVWLIMSIPAMVAGDFGAVFTIAIWFGLYFMRALTEERHLLADPDYVEYCKKVRYRFIPGVY
jgi:protein-S-isoprenylcysteine O-methyltransferase Ste14